MPEAEATDPDHHDPVRAAFWTLQQIIPPFWWESPPNQATADVMQGIDALSKVLDRNCSVSPIDLRRVVALADLLEDVTGSERASRDRLRAVASRGAGSL